MMIGSRSGHARALVFLAAVVAVSSAAAQYKARCRTRRLPRIPVQFPFPIHHRSFRRPVPFCRRQAPFRRHLS